MSSAICTQSYITCILDVFTVLYVSGDVVIMTSIDPQALSDEDKLRLRTLVHTTFTPGTPVNRLAMLAGRIKQIDKVLEAVFSPGQHAAIYGERGVGKSSLANLIYDIIFQIGR